MSKVCEVCGDEIDTKDGENRCQEHEETVRTPKKAKKKRMSRKALYASLGMEEVRGALGGVYYE